MPPPNSARGPAPLVPGLAVPAAATHSVPKSARGKPKSGSGTARGSLSAPFAAPLSARGKPKSSSGAKQPMAKPAKSAIEPSASADGGVVNLDQRSNSAVADGKVAAPATAPATAAASSSSSSSSSSAGAVLPKLLTRTTCSSSSSSSSSRPAPEQPAVGKSNSIASASSTSNASHGPAGATPETIGVWKEFVETFDMGATSVDVNDSFKLRKVFDKIDLDGGGTIDRNELKTALQTQLGKPAISESEVNSMMSIADTDGNGSLNFQEFASIARFAAAAAKIQQVVRQRAGRLLSLDNAAEGAGADGVVLSVAPRPRLQAPARVLQTAMGVGGAGKRGPAVSLPEGKAAEEGEDDEELPEGVWTAAKWLSALDMPKVISRAPTRPLPCMQVPITALLPYSPQVISRALKIPRAATGGQSAFEYVKKLKPEQIDTLLNAASLGGLVDTISAGVKKLQSQTAASSSQLNDKFQASGKFQMSYGSLSLFYGGLESLIGPPQVSALKCLRLPSDCP